MPRLWRALLPLALVLFELLQLQQAAPWGRKYDRQQGTRESRLRSEGTGAVGLNLYVVYAANREGSLVLKEVFTGRGSGVHRSLDAAGAVSGERDSDGSQVPLRGRRGFKSMSVLLTDSEAVVLSGSPGVAAVEMLSPELKLAPSARRLLGGGHLGELGGDEDSAVAHQHSFSPIEVPWGAVAGRGGGRTMLSSARVGGVEEVGSREKVVVLVLVPGDKEASDIAAEWENSPQGIEAGISARASGPDEVTVEVGRDRRRGLVRWLSQQEASLWIEAPARHYVKNKYASVVTQGGLAKAGSASHPIWERGLRGEGEIIGVADTGVDYDHCMFVDNAKPGGPSVCKSDTFSGQMQAGCLPDLKHRKIILYRYFVSNSSSLDDTSIPGDQALVPQAGSRESGGGHGSHIAGSLVGSVVNGTARSHNDSAHSAKPGVNPSKPESFDGAAPGAKLIFDDLYNEDTDPGYIHAIPDSLGKGLMGPAYEHGARIYSISWGSDDYDYSRDSMDIDGFVFDHDDLLVLVAVGNEGYDDDNEFQSFSVGSPATGKNVLSIGASWNSMDATMQHGSSRDLAHLFIVPLPAQPSTYYAAEYRSVSADFSGRVSDSTPLEVVEALPIDACNSSNMDAPLVVLANAQAVHGKAVVIDRGSCFFVHKATAAQAAGAKLVIVANSNPSPKPDEPFEMNAPEGYWEEDYALTRVEIPCVMVSFSAGEALKRLAQHKGRVGFLDTARNLADFSSRGPMHYDLRIKPDVVCPGTSVMSAASDGRLDSNQCGGGDSKAFGLMSGTSMATPVCAGAAALVREYLREGWHVAGIKDLGKSMSQPSAALIKAMMIHSAVPPFARNADSGGRRMPPAGLGPTNDYGYGVVNLSTVLSFDGERDLIVLDRLEINEGDEPHLICLRVKSGAERLRASLVWTEKAGHPSFVTQLLNDLDLVLVGPGKRLTYGNHLMATDMKGTRPVRDGINNAEQITVPRPSEGLYALAVRSRYFWDSLPQKYSLVVSGQFTQETSCPKAEAVGSLCAQDCSGHGVCDPGGFCKCSVEYYGEECSIPVSPLYDQSEVQWQVSSSGWTYFVWHMDAPGPFEVNFEGSNDPDFYLRYNDVPTQDWSFHDESDSRSGGTRSGFKYEPGSKGWWVLGILAYCCKDSQGTISLRASNAWPNPNAPPPPPATPMPSPPPNASPSKTPAPPIGGPSPLPTPARTPASPGGTTDPMYKVEPELMMASLTFAQTPALGQTEVTLRFLVTQALQSDASLTLSLPGFTLDSSIVISALRTSPIHSGGALGGSWNENSERFTVAMPRQGSWPVGNAIISVTIPSGALQTPAGGLLDNDPRLGVLLSLASVGSDKWLVPSKLTNSRVKALPPFTAQVAHSQESVMVMTRAKEGSLVAFPPGCFSASVDVSVSVERLDSSMPAPAGSDAVGDVLAVQINGGLPMVEVGIKLGIPNGYLYGREARRDGSAGSDDGDDGDDTWLGDDEDDGGRSLLGEELGVTGGARGGAVGGSRRSALPGLSVLRLHWHDSRNREWRLIRDSGFSARKKSVTGSVPPEVFALSGSVSFSAVRFAVFAVPPGAAVSVPSKSPVSTSSPNPDSTIPPTDPAKNNHGISISTLWIVIPSVLCFIMLSSAVLSLWRRRRTALSSDYFPQEVEMASTSAGPGYAMAGSLGQAVPNPTASNTTGGWLSSDLPTVPVPVPTRGFVVGRPLVVNAMAPVQVQASNATYGPPLPAPSAPPAPTNMVLQYDELAAALPTSSSQMTLIVQGHGTGSG